MPEKRKKINGQCLTLISFPGECGQLLGIIGMLYSLQVTVFPELSNKNGTI